MTEDISSNVERTPEEQFQERLNSILYTPLSVENIGRFADDALNELIVLSESVVHKYQQEYPESDSLSGAALEDAAYAAYGLENLGTVLGRITVVRDRIAGLAVRIQASLAETGSAIVPPDQTGPAFQDTGSGNYEAPDKLNRLITLAYILETDFDLDQDSVRYRQGTTTDTMVRQEPYVRVEIDDLNRVVYICDEEGNASYVFDTEVLNHLDISVSELDKMTKNQRNAFLRVTPEAGRRIVQSPAWRSVVSEALREPFAADGKIPVLIETTPRSEFAERKQFLEFSDFEAEVRVAYEAAGAPVNVAKWYRANYKNYVKWPPKPHSKYMDKGWQSYPELVGREKIKILDFTDFVLEVRAAYEVSGSPISVFGWYSTEHKKHPRWPADPNQAYSGEGWQGFPELVGREKIERLEFTDFVLEVRAAYEAADRPGDAFKWYRTERERHSSWPSTPPLFYKEKGWRGYPELVGREKVRLLEFEEFVLTVRLAYEEAGKPETVAKWYKTVCKEQSGWPTAPEQSYKDKGWQSYPELVGREKVEFHDYNEFVSDVRVVYEAAGAPINVATWYKEKFKDHPKWPANPQQVYENKGWQSYPELVGREVVEFLEFTDFVSEVNTEYKKAGSPGGTQSWYKKEYKNHSGWPANPDRFYRDKGWQSYPELVGREKIKILDFTDFVSEVRAAYEAAGSPINAKDWYKTECKKQSRWPAAPEQSYKDKDWYGYPALVGKI